MQRMRRLIVGAAIGASMLALVPASAHTNIVIAGFQVVQGGWVNGYGVAPNLKIDDGPATDGTEVWTNLDPVAHRLVGTCVARPSTGSPLCSVGVTRFDVTVQPGQMKELDGLPLGTYVYGDPAYPSMKAQFRVTSSE